MVSLTYPGNRLVSYSYDNADQLLSLTDWNSRTIGSDWTANSQLASQHNPNGVSQTTTYDPVGQISSIETATTSATLARYSYGYDDGGRITSDTVPDPAGSTTSHQYGYDPVSQLTGVTSTPNGGSSIGGTYTATAAGLLTGTAGGDTLAYNAAEQMISRTPASGAATSYSYDANGSRTEAATATTPALSVSYAYGVDGSLATVTSVSGTIAYTSDGDRLQLVHRWTASAASR